MKKQNNGDRAALREVDKYLDNPAAAALRRDGGRHVLIEWTNLYGGKNVVINRALLRVASDLRFRLAGTNPTALDLLLAERVVVAWLFVNWSEYQYVTLVTQLSAQEMAIHLKRIEMAQRHLCTACRTLAKVKRTKLPEVLAMVNVTTPPTARA